MKAGFNDDATLYLLQISPLRKTMISNWTRTLWMLNRLLVHKLFNKLNVVSFYVCLNLNHTVNVYHLRRSE